MSHLNRIQQPPIFLIHVLDDNVLILEVFIRDLIFEVVGGFFGRSLSTENDRI